MKTIFLLSPAMLAMCAHVAAAGTNQLSLAAVLGEALERNPALNSARATATAMDARVPQARAWEDPRAGVDIERMGTTRFFDWTDAEWMVSQAIPINAKNRVRARAASAEAAAAHAEVRQRELELAVRVRSAYARLANAHRQLEINREIESLLQHLVEVSRSRFGAGQGMQSDALMAEGDVVRLLEARRDLERRLSDEQSLLNVLMNRPAQSPLPGPARNVYVELRFSLEALQLAARESRPDLRSARWRISAAEERVTLARRAWIPDPEVRVEARQIRSSGGFINEYDTGLFFSIPWVNRSKYRSAIAEAEKLRDAAGFELESVQAQLDGAVRDQLRKTDTFRENFILFRDRLVPLARQTAEAARNAYINGQGKFLEVMTAFRTLAEVAAVHENHLTDYLVSLVELEGVVGRPLSEIKPQPSIPGTP